MKYYPPRYLFRRFEIMRLVKKGNCFLEIGPGQLNLALDLLERFDKGVLIDFNDTEVGLIFEKLPVEFKRRLELIVADFLQYDRFDLAFDCVVACEVLEHIQNDVSFLQKASNLLKVDGQLILSVPSRQKYWSIHDEIAGHYRRYEKGDLYEKLASAGFAEIKIISYGFPLQNILRLVRIGLAKIQYEERSNWDKERQTQESAFFIRKHPFIDWIGLFVNKYSMYPFSLFTSLFNQMDWGEGYVVSAIKQSSALLS